MGKTKKRTAYSLMKTAERLHNEVAKLASNTKRTQSSFTNTAAGLFEDAAYKLVQAAEALEKEVVRRRVIKKEAERKLREGVSSEGP